VGAKHNTGIMCVTKGVIYQGRTEGMHAWISAHAAQTDLRDLEMAMKNADVFLWRVGQGAVTPAMVASMAEYPVILRWQNRSRIHREAHRSRAEGRRCRHRAE